ncbi:universal stress protein [Halomarina oriensis]|uniref:Universal stress protein n=1 Tax=Halomarina oriensis TaxID=671145 RepID=A0A6B0GN74_9EURY|nr:universal stress protein [Halomarina oriensis]MWG34949.1 universal stress protein [Halomarina oriensis]
MFETVVIATDGSPSAERAVAAAVELAERFDADVHVLSVVEADDDESDEQRVRTTLARFAGEVGRPVTTAVRRGDPAATILQYADRVDADLVATGTRGRDSPYSYHLGSVAERVAHDCPAPVLTVRQLEADAT